MANVPAAAQEFARVFRITRTNIVTGKALLDPLEESAFEVPATSDDFALIAHGLYAAIVYKFCQTSVNVSQIRRWKKSAKPLPTVSEIRSWTDDAERLLSIPVKEALNVLYDGNELGAKRILAAINVASAKTVSPEQLFYSQLMVLWGLADNPLHRFLGVELGIKISQQWIEIIKFTALLKSPRLTVPMIKKACSETCPAMQKPARILLAVEPAISLQIPQDVREKLQTWADGD